MEYPATQSAAWTSGPRQPVPHRRRGGGVGTSTTTDRTAAPSTPAVTPPGGGGSDLTLPLPRAGACARRTWAQRRPGRPERLDIRVDPMTGAGCPATALLQCGPQGAAHRRLRPAQPLPLGDPAGTSEAWIGDVGWGEWEEINRIANPTGGAPVENLGWPCYQGATPDPDTRAPASPLRGPLRRDCDGGGHCPYYAYRHGIRWSPARAAAAARRSRAMPSSRRASVSLSIRL